MEVWEVRGGEGLRTLVIAEGRPEEFVPQSGGIHIEDGALIFVVEATVVRVVAEHQPEIRLSVGARVIIERVAGALLAIGGAVAGRAGIAKDP